MFDTYMHAGYACHPPLWGLPLLLCYVIDVSCVAEQVNYSEADAVRGFIKRVAAQLGQPELVAKVAQVRQLAL